MYLCFESDDKRTAIPESSLIFMDDNGFTIQSSGAGRTGSGQVFFRLSAYQGSVQSFSQALNWIKRTPRKE